MLLTSAAYVHLKQAEFSKYTRNLSPASRAILLSGPAGWLFEISYCLTTLDYEYIHAFIFGTKNNDYLCHFEELYQQMLAKALAHFFEAKMLLLDVLDFSLKVSATGWIFPLFLDCTDDMIVGSTDSEQIW